MPSLNQKKKKEDEKPKPYSFAIDKALTADIEKMDLIKVKPEVDVLKDGIFLDIYMTSHLRSDERDLRAQWVVRNSHVKNTVTFTIDFEGSEGLDYHGDERQTTEIPPKSARMVADISTIDPNNGYTLHNKISYRSEWL